MFRRLPLDMEEIMSKNYIVPTGNILKEYINERSLTQKEICKRISISEKQLSKILNSKSRLTEDFAIKLEKVIPEVPSLYWLNYETKYRESIARKKDFLNLNNLDLKEISNKFKFKEVFEGLDLNEIDMAYEMLKILKISSFDNFSSAYSNMNIDFMEDGGKKEAIAVWVKLCEMEIELQNKDISDISFSIKSLEKEISKFKKIAKNEKVLTSINSCRKLCNKLGIYLVYCPPLSNSKVRGALSTYLGNPVICISGRYKSHDIIWFAIIHELAHLLLHYNMRDIHVLPEENIGKEDSANEFAKDFFIVKKAYEEFIEKKDFSKQAVLQFASNQDILPGIVVGRLQHEKVISSASLSYMKCYI